MIANFSARALLIRRQTVTSSQGDANANRVTMVTTVNYSVVEAFMASNAQGYVLAEMVPPVIQSPESAHAHQDLWVTSARHPVNRDTMGTVVRVSVIRLATSNVTL